MTMRATESKEMKAGEMETMEGGHLSGARRAVYISTKNRHSALPAVKPQLHNSPCTGFCPFD